MLTQERLPEIYWELSAAKLEQKISEHKERFGKSLCILGHHYQRDEVIQFADFTGDSLKLSQLAAGQKDAKYIVFCGVHFMAESADILSADHQVVCLPNLLSGCAMADMATGDAVSTAIEEITAMTDAKVIPITYVNSTAEIKAITARAGGCCCTSGNVANVFEWALRPEGKGGAGAEKILAIPDQHLGRNTAVAMGYAPEECELYDPALPNGGLTREAIDRATFILWKGHCYVHQRFRREHVERIRSLGDETTIIVHPECPRDVVALCDATGSTEQIITAVTDGPPRSRWAIGTESNLVDRLARGHGEKFIRVLSETPATCTQMSLIDLPHLGWILDNLADGKVVNQVGVDPRVAADARMGLRRMVEIKGKEGVTPISRRL